MLKYEYEHVLVVTFPVFAKPSRDAVHVHPSRPMNQVVDTIVTTYV